MSLGQLNGLDTNALMGQSLSPSTTMLNAESAEDAGVKFLSQMNAGQHSSLSVHSPSVARAAAAASDRLPPSAAEGGNVASNDVGANPDQTGETAAPGSQVIPEDSPVTEADLQNMSFDYDGDGIVTVEEAEIGLAIEQGIVQVGITIGGQAVMDMRTQMERARAQSEQIARGG